MITGWRERNGALPEFLLARRQGGDLAPAGSASLGLGADQRTALLAQLQPRRGADAPLAAGGALPGAQRASDRQENARESTILRASPEANLRVRSHRCAATPRVTGGAGLEVG